MKPVLAGILRYVAWLLGALLNPAIVVLNSIVSVSQIAARAPTAMLEDGQKMLYDLADRLDPP